MDEETTKVKPEVEPEVDPKHVEFKIPGYIVVKEEFEDEPLELELEDDGNLRMSTLISQFSGACGLRFRNKETGAMRGVRLHKDLFLPPNGADGWPTDVIFNVVYRYIFCNPYFFSQKSYSVQQFRFFTVKRPFLVHFRPGFPEKL